ncbi:MAG TPA: hypothetical protein VFJ29_02550 [Candidatus Kapabacteria bacterium]|nr:hypothetical protein [Candidatus Kapabacteria bacterium]
MKRFNIIFLLLAVLTGMAVSGFDCSKTPDNSFFVLKRFSSIPAVVRSVVFSSDCSASIHDPINTTTPYVYQMTSGECDSLKSFCQSYDSFDTLYNDTTMHIPNPSVIVMEFHANGELVKSIRIVEFPKIANGLMPLLQCAGNIETRGLNMWKQQQMENIREEKEKEKWEGK